MSKFLLTLILASSGFIASAQMLQTLVSFNGTNGENPNALTLGDDGNFYGTTYFGGDTNLDNGYGAGTIFQVTTNGALITLVSFNNTNGATPQAALTQGGDGNLYGTAALTVFQVTIKGALTTLYKSNSFNAGYASLTPGNDGNFYGTTIGGLNYGTIFQVTTNGALTTLLSFNGNGTNGKYPSAALTLGTDGNFYGTTSYGGISNLGTIFKVTTNGTLTTLISFDGANGANNNSNGVQPNAALTFGNDGNFYGTTVYGGQNGYGTMFKMTTNGTLTTLVSFNGINGFSPFAQLTLGNDGNFYGTTYYGGNTNLVTQGLGTIFRVTTNGTLTTLVSFNGTNGTYPSVLTLGIDGNFYGTTYGGGSANLGTVFRLLIPPVVKPTLTLQFWAGYPLLSMYGTLSNTYTVEFTTNLAVPNWTPMLIVPNLSISPFQMIDPAGVGQRARFYRALMQ